MTLAERIDSIQERIARAAERAGRAPDSVLLLPASKNVAPDILRQAWDLGLRCFGENRIQEARAKIPLLPSACRWHFIGGLQKNKARDAVRGFELIHSVDSCGLADELEKRAAQAGREQAVLVEVNTGGEACKHGVLPESAEALVLHVNAQQHLRVRGLMTVPPAVEDPERARIYFAALRDCRDRIEASTGLTLPELSMGMTHDFEAAIQEGATIVRIGTGLFGARHG